jgi:hypothetical protein
LAITPKGERQTLPTLATRVVQLMLDKVG